MGVIEEYVALALDITQKIDREVSRGFNLYDWGDLMKFLHALQVQAQILIDIACIVCSRVGRVPRTYADAGRILHELGVFTDEDLAFYKRVVSFRNVVVHMYARIDVSLIDNILRSRQYRRVLELIKKIYDFSKKNKLDC